MQQKRSAAEIKEGILRTIRIRGPSLPVHVTRETGQSILFTSAFLSELLSEKQLKISNMKVGSSPVYFIPGQEPQLDKYANDHLKSKEKEAYLLLKEEKFLIDSEQEPAIRVALRALKDFAFSFEKNGKIIWRYLTEKESDFEAPPTENKNEEPEKETENKNLLKDKNDRVDGRGSEALVGGAEKTSQKESLEELTEKETPKPKKKTIKKKSASPTKKAQEKFFNRVKEFLEEKNADILEIISAGKSDLILRIKIKNSEKILVAYNKKRITEKEILNAHKKAKEHDLSYLIFSLGDLPKKVQDLIDALKSLANIEKIE